MPGLDQVQSMTLANGMKVIVWTDRDIPNVALYNWVRVGSRNEVPGITGLAHFFEHMMFNGTAQAHAGRVRPAHGSAGRLQQRVHQRRRHGLPGLDSRAPRSIWCSTSKPIASRISRSIPKVIESERGVVYSERRLRIEDSNDGFLAEQVQATAFVAHPYQIPTIGWPADIQGWKIEDLQKFFKTNYAPNNCTLILVGDLVRRRRLRAREEIPRAHSEAGAAAAGAHHASPSSSARSACSCSASAQTPLLQYAYKSPAANDPQGPAINLLLSVLTEGDSSRLHRLLVEEKKLAIDVGGHFARRIRSRRSRGCSSRCPKARRSPKSRRCWMRRSTQVVAQGVTDAELRRAKNLYAVVVLEAARHHRRQGAAARRVRRVRRRLPASCSIRRPRSTR